MLKRIFLIFAFALMTIFLCWQFNSQQNQIRFSHYSGTDVLGVDNQKTAAHREELSKQLNTLAKENHSLIARRIVAPTAGQQTHFVYEKYGQGSLPDGLKAASPTLAQTSDLANSYLIVRGPLTAITLTNTLRRLGYSAVTAAPESVLSLLSGLVSVPTTVLSFAILLLCFMAMTLIYRIQGFKEAGIKLIAGRTIWSVVLEPVRMDLIDIVATMLICDLAGMLFLAVTGLLQWTIMAILLLGLLLMTIALFSISLLLSLVYLFGLDKARLTQLLKGRLPLKWLLFLILMSQFTAIVLVGNSLAASFSYRDQLREQNQTRSNWQQNADRYTLSFGAFIAGGSAQESYKRNQVWYRFINQAVQKQDALLVNNNLNRYQDSDTSDGIKETDYLPEGHTIYVTPNYFQKQHIALNRRLQRQLTHLKRGQFALIMPEKLRSRKNSLTKIYTQSMNSYGQSGLSEHGRQLYTFQAKTGFVPDHQARFLYNVNFGIVDQQTLTDPIIVVVTPESMGNTASSALFWSSVVGNSVLFKDYQPTIALSKQRQVYPWISYLQNARLQYLKNIQTLRTQLLSTLVGAIMSVLVAIILFALMNLLYFEEFRRDIFIKRVSGLSSIAIHRYYLLAQAILLASSALIIFILTSQATVSVLTLLVFVCLAGIMLYRQMQVENKQAVTTLKGK